MRRFVLIGTLALLWAGSASAGEPDSISDLVAQYEILKTQSLSLIQTVRSLEQERQQLRAEVEMLRQENKVLAPQVRELSESLDATRRSLQTLRKQHAVAVARVEELQREQMRALMEQMKELAK